MSQKIRIPYYIRLLLTNRCNLSCDFCLANATPHAGQGELSTEEWLAFIKRLKELKVFNVTLSGGEIFMREDIFTLLEQLRANRMHRLTVLTNGTLLSRTTAKKLKELQIKSIMVSLGGMEEEHDRQRGAGAFQKTLEGIRTLIEEGIIPSISFTPTRKSCKDLPFMIDTLHSLGIPSLRLNSLKPEGRCNQIFKELALRNPTDIEDILKVLKEKEEKYPAFRVRCELDFYYRLPGLYRQYKAQKEPVEIRHLKEGCGAAATSCTVTAAGDVIPCEGLGAFPGGNIREKDFVEIWEKSENLKKIRRLRDVSLADTPICKDCKYNRICDGGCRASAYLIHKDLLAPNLSCPCFKGEAKV